jgi:hypothetical protein
MIRNISIKTNKSTIKPNCASPLGAQARRGREPETRAQPAMALYARLPEGFRVRLTMPRRHAVQFWLVGLESQGVLLEAQLGIYPP